MAHPLEAKASNLILKISDLQERLSSRKPLKIKSEEELMSQDNLLALSEAMSLAAKYKEPGALDTVDPGTVKEDILRLSALNINIAQAAGILGSRVKAGEDAMTLEKAEAFLSLKSMRDTLKDQGVKIQATEDDIKNAARTSIREIVLDTADARSAAEMTRFSYYAIRDFVGILKDTAYRIINSENDNVSIN